MAIVWVGSRAVTYKVVAYLVRVLVFRSVGSSCQYEGALHLQVLTIDIGIIA